LGLGLIGSRVYDGKKGDVMKKLIITFSFCAIFILVCPFAANAQVSPEAMQAFQAANIRIIEQRTDPIDFTLPLLGGGTKTLSSYKGQVVILNFWATWCPPCRAEMPSMETLYQRFKAQGLEILAVDIGEDNATVQRFINNNRYTFPVLMDTNKRVSTLYGIEAIPTSYIIDREGKIIAKITGSIHWDTPRIIAAFDALLKSK